MKVSGRLNTRFFPKIAAAGSAVVLIGLGLASPAQAEDVALVPVNVIVDGTFSAPEAPEGSFATYGTGTRFGGLTGTAWVVTGGSIDHLSEAWNPPPAGTPAGTQSVDLNGTGPGTLAQSVGTVPAARYTVSFAYKGNTDPGCFAGPAVKTASLAFGGVQGPVAAQFAPQGSNAAWQNYSATFTASGWASDLVLAGTNPSACGMFVSDVKVTLVPVLTVSVP